jgi:ABC-type ATPase involved in cell division
LVEAVLPSFVSVTEQFLVAIQRLVVVQQRVLLAGAPLAEQLQLLAHTGLEQRLVVEVHTDH